MNGKVKRIPSLKPVDISLSRSVQSSRYLFSYLFSVGIIALVTMLGLFIRDIITPTNLVMPYLLGVVSIAVLWGRGPAIFASVLGVIAFDIFLVPPYLTFVVEDTEYVITFISLFLVGVVISGLTARIKEQMVEAKEREARVTSLYHLSQELTVAYALPDVANTIIKHMGELLHQDVVLFLVDPDKPAEIPPVFEEIPAQDSKIGAADEAVVYAYQNGLPSGSGTQAFTHLDRINLPLITNSGILGVVCISTRGQDASLDQFQIYEAFTNLAALAIERIYLNRQASQTQLLKAKEELQSALLNSVSHDFRTPLVTITGTLSSLDSEIHQLDPVSQHNLVRYALREAGKLNRLVSNLLNMSRLESGALYLQREPVDVQDLIGATLEQMKNRMDRPVHIHIPDELPLISADFVLVEQALMNILENALKYSPEDSPIDIDVHILDGWVTLDIADRGYGLDANEIPNIFNKFYRAKVKGKVGGTGLGLAIVKGIIDAHEARLSAIPREGGGMIFRIGFPQLEFDEAV